MKGMENTMKPHQIADAVLTWNTYPGFCGEVCSECKAEVNTFNGGPGWHCPRCDAYNVQCWSGGMGRFPWQHPDFGPTKTTIHKGHKMAHRNARRQRIFADGENVLVVLGGGNWWLLPLDKAFWSIARIVSMEEMEHPSMRYYIVRLMDGKKVRLYERYIAKMKKKALPFPGGGYVELEKVPRSLKNIPKPGSDAGWREWQAENPI